MRYSPIEERIKIRFIILQAFGKGFDRFFILFISEKDFTLLKVLLTLQ